MAISYSSGMLLDIRDYLKKYKTESLNLSIPLRLTTFLFLNKNCNILDNNKLAEIFDSGFIFQVSFAHSVS